MSYLATPRSGAQQHAYGMARERQFFEAFYCYPIELPDDVYMVLPGTHEEDQNGVDGWAYTEYGRIPLQITSSRNCAELHWQKRPNTPAVMLVVYETDTPEEIRTQTLRHLQTCLERFRRESERK